MIDFPLVDLSNNQSLSGFSAYFAPMKSHVPPGLSKISVCAPVKLEEKEELALASSEHTITDYVHCFHHIHFYIPCLSKVDTCV